ncbi:MAG TPA: hypothetical protein PKC28_03420 [Bdellovibrionales bacterium]|nr:hypothetical protein [Bdellovibrionales bacterium]
MSDLQIQDDIRFQRKTWIVQRVGWILLCVVVVLAFLGFTGPSELTTAKITDANLKLEFPRFARQETDFAVKIELGPGSDRIEISNELLEKINIVEVAPFPRAQIATKEFTVLVFDRDAVSSVPIHFRLKPLRYGRLHGEIRLAGGEGRADLNPFVFF